MSNTDGEDTQKVSLGELLLNAGTRIVDLEKQSNDQVEIITHLEKELASLREQLKEANEIIGVLPKEEIRMLNLTIKQQEEVIRELTDLIGDILASQEQFGTLTTNLIEKAKSLTTKDK